ncbi:GNAT family N-acetyltransferase [Enterovibrio norvegicus]|uniref:GNAT family N-acetyltransferase n=1 Tax=Enterovibrio norvegicus TaxID=188144 RepID=UPI003D13E061
MTYNREGFSISNDENKVDVIRLKALLAGSYWAHDRDIDTIARSIKHSECFSLCDNDYFVGFARVVTDYSTFAYVADVIVDPDYRGKGLGKWLVDTVVNDARWKGQLMMLATDDAHALYERHGFSNSQKFMGINCR